jgi:hypothetical protein
MLTFEDDCEAVLTGKPLIVSFRQLGFALRDPRLNRSHLRVLYNIMDHLNHQTGTAFPSRRTIAAEEELSDGRVADLLYDLRKWGYVTWLRKSAPGLHPGQLLHYTLPIARWTDDEIRAGIAQFLEDRKPKKLPGGAGSLNLPAIAGTSGEKLPGGAGSYRDETTRYSQEKTTRYSGHSNLIREPAKRESARAKVSAPKKPASAQPQKTRLADDWTLPCDSRDYARDKGLTDAQIDLVAEDFHAYWRSGNAKDSGLKADWPATWQSWIRRLVNEGRVPKLPSNPPANGAHPELSHLPEHIRRLREAELAEEGSS